jgi:hypothetical protein
MATVGETSRPGYVYDSATDVWIPVGIGPHSHTPAAIGAISSSVVTTKGDLIVATGSGVVTRQGVGADGSYLVADSTQADGLNWAGPSNTAGKNAVLNSNFSVWQRGTSVAGIAGVAYTADRWCIARNSYAAGATVSRQVTNDTTNLPFIQYCARVQRDSGNTSTLALNFAQSFESINSIPLAGKTATVSFYARSGANFSSASNNLTFIGQTGTGTDQNLLLGYTGASNTFVTVATLTTTWQRFSVTATIPTTATEFGAFFTYTAVGTAGANDYFEITGVQLEVGSVATPYAPNGATQQAELAACRYYYRRNTSTAGYGVILPVGSAASTTLAALTFTDGPMRINPTSVDFATNFLDDGAGVTAVTNITINGASSASVPVLTVTVASGLTAFRPYRLTVNAGAAGYIGVSAEL